METGERLILNTTFEITPNNLHTLLQFAKDNPEVTIRGVRLGDRIFAKLGEGGRGHTGIFIDTLGLQISTEDPAPIILAHVSASVKNRYSEFVIESPERSQEMWGTIGLTDVTQHPVAAFTLASSDGVTPRFGDSSFFGSWLSSEAHALTSFCLHNLPEEGVLPELAINN